jgi:hypothetical protein
VIIDHLLVVFRIEALRRLDRLLAIDALRVHRRQASPVKADIGLLLVHRLLIAAAPRRIAEQEFDEAAAHVGSHAHRGCGLRGGRID